jgi:hypothetical protein
MSDYSNYSNNEIRFGNNRVITSLNAPRALFGSPLRRAKYTKQKSASTKSIHEKSNTTSPPWCVGFVEI